MGTSTKDLGNWGEQRAAAYLEAKGCKILQRNFRLGQLGEIDLIVDDQGMLVFVEVKSQASAGMGDAATWVTPRKQRQIGKIALAYLTFNQIQDRDCRFDVIVVSRSSQGVDIQHIPNAFWL
jgi:putative endonuclease